MKIDIKPITETLDKLQILNIIVNIDQSAKIVYDISGSEIAKGGTLFMDSETYKNWGTDDEYVVNWVLQQLGLEKA